MPGKPPRGGFRPGPPRTGGGPRPGGGGRPGGGRPGTRGPNTNGAVGGERMAQVRRGPARPEEPVMLPAVISVGDLSDRLMLSPTGDHQGADRCRRLRQHQPADRLRDRREGRSGAGNPGDARRAGDGRRGDHHRHRYPCDDRWHGHAPAGRHDHGPRRPRQDQAARRDPLDQRRRRRGGRHHPAHRRVSGRGAGAEDHLPRYPRPRGIHRHARARRAGHRHRGAGGRRRRRRDAADAGGDRPRPGGRTCRSSWRSTRSTGRTPTRSASSSNSPRTD